jgi:hypothetical protein
VKKRCGPNRVQLLFVPDAECLSNCHCVALHASDMAMGNLVLARR